MASSTNTLTIRVPAVLKNRIEKVSALQGVSINQFALYAFTKEIAELEKQSPFRRYPQQHQQETATAGGG